MDNRIYKIIAHDNVSRCIKSVGTHADLSRAINDKISMELSNSYPNHTFTIEDNIGNIFIILLEHKHIKQGATYYDKMINNKLVLIDNDFNLGLSMFNLDKTNYHIRNITNSYINRKLITGNWEYIGQHENIPTIKLLYT